MKSKIILISGYPATGKSTFAKKLSEHLGIPCFKKDTIKEAMADGFGADSEEIFKKGSVATFSVMCHIAECFLKIGTPCILESNFRLSEGEELEKLTKNSGCKVLTYVFAGDPETLYERCAIRDNSGERHWVHMAAGKDYFKNAFIDGCIKHKIGQIEVGEVINVDATDFGKIDFDELLSIAKKFIYREDYQK
ncbi:MAG: ATP-binding protein [Defluviitaleaceae bacterium]|nr:ATP-binding protein [Defluviitaleaceae bacterium]